MCVQTPLMNSTDAFLSFSLPSTRFRFNISAVCHDDDVRNVFHPPFFFLYPPMLYLLDFRESFFFFFLDRTFFET